MARRKQNKPKQSVNKVRRKAQNQELEMGSQRALPKDEVKKHRSKTSEIKKGGKRKVAKSDINIRKGKPPKKEKVVEKKPDLRLRTEVEKEYTKALRNLRQRLKYREKQGYFVKWETLPSRPTRITQSDLDRLAQYEVQLNELNEIELVRTEYNKQARDVSNKLRVKYQNQPNYTIENDPNFIPPPESVQNFDVFDRIERAFIENISYCNEQGVELDHYLDDDIWVELSNSVIKAYYEAYDKFIALRDSPKREQYADYLFAHETEVTEAIDVVKTVSTQEQLDEAKEDMLRYIEMH